MMELRDLIIPLALVGAIVALGLMVLDGIQEESMPDYEYLQCVPFSEFGEGVTSVTGCAEVVEIGGERYLRMKDVGSFSVYRGSSSAIYTVGKAHIDLILQTGQSNAYGLIAANCYPDAIDYDPDATPGRSPLPPGVAFYVGPLGGDDEHAGIMFGANFAESRVYDMTDEDGNVRMANDYPTFLYGYWQSTGHRVVMANTALGGRSIDSFVEPGQDCYRRTSQILGIVDGLLDSEHYVVEPVAVLWSQGEADRLMTVQEYESKFIQLMDNFEDGVYGIAFPRLFTTLPRHPMEEGLSNPALAQIAAAEEDERITVACSLATRLPTGLPYYKDDFHYTEMVYNWVGEAFAISVASSLGFQPVPESIVLCSVEDAVELPSTVQAVGTTGNLHAVKVAWGEPSGGEAEGTVVWTPSGTVQAPGLKATATVSEDDS